MSCGVGHSLDSDLALLWHGLAATALTGPLAGGTFPCVVGAALKSKKKKKKKKEYWKIGSSLHGSAVNEPD